MTPIFHKNQQIWWFATMAIISNTQCQGNLFRGIDNKTVSS